MKEAVFFFNDSQQLIKVVQQHEIIESIQTREITSDQADLMLDQLDVTCLYHPDIAKASYMGVREYADSKKMTLYRILKITEIDKNKLQFIGSNFAYTELDGYIVNEIRLTDVSLATVLKQVLKETDWHVKTISDNLKKITTDFYYISVKECLKQIQILANCEIQFLTKVNGNGVYEKGIHVFNKLGVASNVRFTYGDRALEIVKEIDRQNVITSLIGRGRGEDVGDGNGKRVDFTNVEWLKSNGDPLNKPKGQSYLEDVMATEKYGIPTINGKMKRREQVITFDDEEDPKKLLEKTYTLLKTNSRPLVQFKTSVLEGDNIGNMVTIHRYDRNYHYRTRIFKTVLNRLNWQIQCDLGDNLTSNMSQKSSHLENTVKEIDEKKLDFYEVTETSKFNDDIIRGAHGGSVMLMNPQDMGIGDSREPFQMVWMNGASIKDSTHFLVANSEGIGFIDGEFNLDKFKTAWTIDGKFNADYIQAGTLNGVKIQAENENFLIELFNGHIDFSDATNQKLLGRILATLGSGQVNGMAIEQRPGYIFSLNSGSKDKPGTSKAVVQIPSDSTMDNRKLNLFGETVLNGSLNIKGKLLINGQEITPGGTGGGSGGGWDGQYPPEITSQADKLAWELYQMLLHKGYSKQSACGILGNVQGEVGNGMNPDTVQSGGSGPGYGIAQWDGSAYPLVGAPTWNGREYVQRLVNHAGIKGDYRSMETQGELLDWCMYNGQWIGQVNPTIVAGFKAETSPENAAYAFEKNFERPATTHPERQGWARQWYNKFKNLKQPESKGYLVPVKTPYIVTSWYGSRPEIDGFHKGIDFGGNIGEPVFATRAGKVIYAQFNNGGFGNFVCIDHGNGKFSNYGHMNALHTSPGTSVKQGDRIGDIGSTGWSTGPHLHFAISDGLFGNYEDPALLLGIHP